MTKILFITLLILSSVLFSCADSFLGSDEEEISKSQIYDLVRRGDFVDYEAEHAALWISDELVAPEELYIRIKERLKELRETWSDSIPEVNYPVLPAFTYSGVDLWFNDSVRIEYLSGNWNELDSLNEYYNYDSISHIIEVEENLNKITVIFKGRLNSEELMRSYSSALKERADVLDYRWKHKFNIPHMIIWMLDNRLTFLIIKENLNVNDHFYNNHFWYFKENDEEIEFLGYRSGESKSFLDWFRESYKSLQHFWRYYDFTE